MKIKKFFKNRKLNAVIKTARNLLKRYGFRGLIKGLINKLRGYPLAAGIAVTTDIKIRQTQEARDQIGREILSEQQNELSPKEQINQILRFAYQPKLSVIMPLCGEPAEWLKKTIASLRSQSYANWELCAAGAQALPLMEEWQKEDERIQFQHSAQNGEPAADAALNTAMGEYAVILDPGDELTPDAFFQIVSEINRYPDTELLYSDECAAQDSVMPQPHDFLFKPDRPFALPRGDMYIGRVAVYRMAAFRAAGGFHRQCDLTQDCALTPRAAETAISIRHIERVLCFRHTPSSAEKGETEFADRDLPATPEHPLVSVVIVADSKKAMEKCVKGLIGETTDYRNLEIIPVAKAKLIRHVRSVFPTLSNMKPCLCDTPGNLSEKWNTGARAAVGEYLIFCRDGIRPLSRDWVEQMIKVLQYEGVGAVSPMILDENQNIDYNGLIYHPLVQENISVCGAPSAADGHARGIYSMTRDVSVLSGVCVMLAKDLYNQIGGFDAAHTPNGYSNVDFSFRISERGLRCAYTPSAALTHTDAHARNTKRIPDKAQLYCLKRWSAYLTKDAYFTKSMKRAYYDDAKTNYRVYAPEKLANAENPNARNILFLSHELTLTGAPIQLMDVVKASILRGDFPVVVSPQSGPLLEKYLQMGVPVIVDHSAVTAPTFFYQFSQSFSLVVVNTLVMTLAIKYLSNGNVPVLWWIHEGKEVIDALRDQIPKTLGKNIHIYDASEYSQRLLSKLGKRYQSEILRCAVDDIARGRTASFVKNDRLLFLTIGSIARHKAQDVLLLAIDRLPPEYRAKAKFLIVGNPKQDEIGMMVRQYEQKNDCVEVRGLMPRDEVLKLYEQSICSIIPSRDETTSMIGIESMMFSRAILSSDKTGIGEFVHNGEDSYLFKSEDSEQLADIIKHVIDHPQETIEMGKKARLIYENNYLMSTLHTSYQLIVDHLTEG